MKTWVKEAIGYGAASVCALAADMALLWFFVRCLSLDYLLAASISFIFGATIAYLAAIKLAFHHHRLRNRGAEFISFVAIGVPGLAVNAGVISIAMKYFGLHLLVAKAMAAALTFGCNFVARRQILFLRQSSC